VAARDRFKEAQAEYGRAAQEAQKVLVGQVDQAKAAAATARGEADKADAKQYVPPLWAAAGGKETEGQRALQAKQYVAARDRFKEAQAEYGRAAQEAQKVLLGLVDQAKAAAAAARGEAEKADAKQYAGPLLAAATARETEGQKAYDAKQYGPARQRFQEAQAEYQKARDEAKRVAAIPKPTPAPQPDVEIRKVLDDYKRAIESKDLALFLKVRPVSASEAKKVEDSFKQSRSQRVELEVQKIDVTGDQAEARGRRRDEFVSAQGQTFKNEAAFVYRFRRTDAGWVIADVR
jgi:hypothetical protein